MAQTFPPGVTIRNTDVRKHEIQVHRHDNYALGVTLHRCIRLEQKEMILRNLTQESIEPQHTCTSHSLVLKG